MTIPNTPALARLGASTLALCPSTPTADWLVHAEEAAHHVLTGAQDDRSVAVMDWMIDHDAVFRPYETTEGVAVIPVRGLLLKDYPWIGDRWATGYAQLRWQLEVALDDPDVASIALWIESSGGFVDGLFELTAFIREARAIKEIHAIVDGVACSAAYAIAAATWSIAAGPFSAVGSIGVVVIHWNFGKALADFGIVPTMLFSGEHKVDGNPFEALPEEVADRWRAELDAGRRYFAEDVALGRGDRLSAEAALATEADTYSGPDGPKIAMDQGLIDAVAFPGDALDALATTPPAKGS